MGGYGCMKCGDPRHLAIDCPELQSKRPAQKRFTVNTKLSGSVTSSSVTSKTKQQRWKDRNAERFRDHRKEYMRQYREKKKKSTPGIDGASCQKVFGGTRSGEGD